MAEHMEKVAKKAITRAKESIGLIKGKQKAKKPEKEERKATNDDEMADEGADKSESDESEAEGVSFEAKVQFTEKVRRLTNEGLTRLVKMVRSKCRDALEDVDSEKLHIQVDKIDKESFEVLSKLVDDNLVKSGKSNKRQKTE